MLTRVRGYFAFRSGAEFSTESQELEKNGHTLLQGVFNGVEVQALAEEISRVFETKPRSNRAGGSRTDADDECFRYEMLNHSPLSQLAIANPKILATIEPLLGEDCHVIANTAWRNPPNDTSSHGGQAWHIDAGPHIPLPAGTTWPEHIPHPVFAIGTHIYLKDCELADGPTGVLEGSHLSGAFPPPKQALDDDLTYNGKNVTPLLAKAGDVGMFVSDIWHRRMTTMEGDQGRFFLQAHYGRRDIAQRISTTKTTNHLSKEAINRASTQREQALIGLHKPFFYDG
ncbi:MAG: ectoine hydroxylase-related dioxygenase (phytanoyl-CoA dioxygenase family) [Candidatus Azotimanducaceae bacterium]|jgi:ectoine hydroxylase-related dioxygenase (phytanoyl-CoA dioxygenase family)